jgi:streptogramin lyase
MNGNTVVAAAAVLFGIVGAAGCTHKAESVRPDAASIGGVVVNEVTHRPEAGVWVIAETLSLATPYRRIVVTDDLGRFLVPDLPEASFDVWTRGYGLKDSPPIRAARGGVVTINVSTATDLRAAARIYPANYWLSLYQPPTPQELPKWFQTQADWVADWKLSCIVCHQQGYELTRLWTRPEYWDLVWHRATSMERSAERLGHDALRSANADWASRIAEGEVPPQPPRPTGIERNVVLTEWAWGQNDSYIHDEIATDKRHPSLYPYGKVWGLDYGQDKVWSLDPVSNQVVSYQVPTRNVLAPRGGRDDEAPAGDWAALNNPANPHNLLLDERGKLWITTQVRGEQASDYPRWAHDVIDVATGPPVPKLIANRPQELPSPTGHHRQLGYFDTKTEQFALLDTAYGTHHLQFDGQGRIWTSGDSVGLGMFDPSRLDPQHPEESAPRAQTMWLNINSETGKPRTGGGYGICVSLFDGTVWRAFPGGGFGPSRTGEVDPHFSSSLGSGPGGNKIQKFDPKTRTFRDYPLPKPGFGPRGLDATSDGKIWFGTGSGHLGRFDPQTEQFKYWESPGPKIKGMGSETGSADFHYYIFADQFDTLGLGKDMIILMGTNSDSLLVFDPVNERFTVLRVPYPIGFFSRGVDGRIDDPKAGWKGRGLWADYGTDAVPLFTEKGLASHLVHFQIRPHPLAP